MVVEIKPVLHKDTKLPNNDASLTEAEQELRTLIRQAPIFDPGISPPAQMKSYTERRFSFARNPDANKTQQTATASLPINRESGSV
jgi:hypothetical protein